MEDQPDILDGLEERLQSHAKAFESLLALTPARDYFGSQIDDGQDPSEQWNRKKQSKEEKRAAKKAKLDPANQKSALDVMKERERKRKRELGMNDDEDGNEKQEAGDGADKRQKVEDGEDATEAKRRAKAEKRKEKRQAKNEKVARKKAKVEAKKAAKQSQDLDGAQAEKTQSGGAATLDEDDDEAEPESMEHDAELGAFDASGLAEESTHGLDEENEDQALEESSVPSSPAADSPAFDIATNHSTASSSSSVIPPSLSEQPQLLEQAAPRPVVNARVAPSARVEPPQKRTDPPSGASSPKIQLPNIDQEQLQERLRQRIEELRARRKADGPDGKPAKSRQELLEQRRKKEEQRKAAKKDQRRKAKEEEERKREEHLRGSGSPLSSADVFSPSSPRPQDNSFSFSRLAFEDGTAADAALTGLSDPRRKKGPQDPRTALEAVQKKQARIAGYDEDKRADIAEKDLWLNAKKRAHGERVRDDTSLLKKALKRKEKQKGKSEKEWQERGQAVVHGKEMKQKKRDANLAKRKEEKGGKGKKKTGGPKAGGKKKGRPGFEGRFKV